MTTQQIPEPSDDPRSLRLAVSIMRQVVNTIVGFKGNPYSASPTAQQLIDLGVISKEDWDRIVNAR